MKPKKLFDLELVSANDSYRVAMSADGRGIVLAYDLEVAPNTFEFHKLVFAGGRAYRWTWVRLCTPDMVEAYDSVVEVLRSQWVTEAVEQLKNDPGEADHLGLHHYMVFLDEDGCYEVLAESVSIERDEAPAGRRPS